MSGDFASTAAVSTWLSMGELQEYKQVEGRKEKEKARNREEEVGRSRLGKTYLQSAPCKDAEGLCDAKHMLQT